MSKDFNQCVQSHEQVWGVQSYPGRPLMADILNAQVVAFWSDSTIKSADVQIITLHDDMKPIHAYFSSLARRLAIGFPNRRLVMLFDTGKEVRVKEASLVLQRMK